MRNWVNTAVKILLSASLVLVLFLQNGLHTVYSDPEVTITVKTIDNVALPNAVVKAYTVVDGNKLLNDTKTTDSSGKVTLSIRENKNYRLEIFYPSGFLVNVTTNFNYSALPKKELYVYVLSKWTLRITDKYGRDPLPNVFVRITHSENNSITQTG
ncbi:MAG: hypothetical protein LZ173_03500, partial [Thaumarchaeota archaeon]|nr:hypothetical protein [Candidatus Geocrenenecus arthurdayi]